MDLFNIFRDTVFLKEESNLERQIEELKRIPDYSVNKDILGEIRSLEYGLRGEKEIAFELKNASIGMYVIHDVTLEYDDLVAQIDYVIITKGYIYLVECKNLYGNITVGADGVFKREYELNGKKYNEAIYSPYTQAVRHKDILKKIWFKNANSLLAILGERLFDKSCYKPLVVIANSKSILNSRFAPRDIKNCTIKVDQLVRYIQDDLKKYDKSMFMSQKKMLEIGKKILAANTNRYFSIASKYGDVPPVLIKNRVSEEIIENLKIFRKTKSKEKGVPAYYIFTDQELKDIIELKPDSLDKLKNAKIMPAIKVNLYGKDIISILNSKNNSK